MPGSEGDSDKTPLELYVNQTVQRNLLLYFQDKDEVGE